MKIYGYARVSSHDQNLQRQMDAFKEFGIDEKNIFCDKKSGKNFERKNYQRLIRKLKNGDLVVVKSIDRLGRNYSAIIREWKKITDKLKANIFVMDMPLLDTRMADGSLTNRLVSDLVLQILSFVAENERRNIIDRQRVGIQAARRRGVQFGRPKEVYSPYFISVINDFDTGKITMKEASDKLKKNRTTIYYHLAKIKNYNEIK